MASRLKCAAERAMRTQGRATCYGQDRFLKRRSSPNCRSKSAPPDSCWGVFGDEDVLGCLDFLTPEGVIEAARMVKKGKIFRLDTRVNYANPPLFERKPAKHILSSFESYGLLGFDDMLDNYNTQEGSQWDGLGHVGNRAIRPSTTARPRTTLRRAG